MIHVYEALKDGQKELQMGKRTVIWKWRPSTKSLIGLGGGGCFHDYKAGDLRILKLCAHLGNYCAFKFQIK